MAFPDILEKDFSVDGKNNKDMREMLDYAANQWYGRDSRRKKLNSLYNSHNGITPPAEVEAIVKSTGKMSKTKFINYRLGRTKLKQLHGEFLEINIEPTVRTTNREAINRKMNKYKESLGLALARPQLERVRQMGYDVFSGIKLPDISDKNTWNANNFKLANELVIQRIIDDKMQNQRLKDTFYQNFVDCTITSEVYGRVERDINGIDTIRYIPVKYALYEEAMWDPFLERTPYAGEVRPMFLHEILTNKEFDLDNEDKKAVRDMASSPTDYTRDITKSGGDYLINVYTIQWKGLEPVYCKISPAKGSTEPYMSIISEEYYNRNEKQIRKQVANGEFKVEKYLREILWTSSRIGNSVYTKATKEKNLIQVLNKNNKYNVQFDYGGMLFSTIDGVRVSIQEVIVELEKTYDEVRFHINREMKKMKGSLVGFDEAFIPKGKNLTDVIHSITEDGIVRFNSSAEGNVSGTETDSNKVGVQAINLGQNQNLVVLLNQAMDIERVMDRVTGMNDNRTGLSRPTTTATANVNSIEASRSMTYDIFYFMKGYIERMLTKLAEKTKINKTMIGADQRAFIFDDSEMIYMMSTEDLDLDNYGITITDGKREKDILNDLKMMFPQEINAGMLRSKDVARFLTENSFSAALRVLDQAHNEMAKIRENEIKVKQESSMAGLNQQLQISREEREDLQQHDKDMEVLRTEGKKEVELLKGGLKNQNDTTKAYSKAATDAVSQPPV